MRWWAGAVLTVALLAQSQGPPSLSAQLPAPPLLRLPPLPPAPAAARPREPLQVGSHRSLPRNAVKKGKWATLKTGARLWRLAVESPGAAALRLHFQAFDAGTGKVWVHTMADGKPQFAGPYTGKGPNGDGDFWTGVLFGASAVIEFQHAAKSKAVPFIIHQLAHRTEP